MEFKKTILIQKFNIQKVISFHYFEHAKNYIFEGETHDFWEFMYVDKGEVKIITDENKYILKQGDIIFHEPNEFHSILTNNVVAPNLMVITFECNTADMSQFKQRVFSLNDRERNILADTLCEGLQTFAPPLDHPEIHTLSRKSNPPFGSEQLIKNYLEILLINLVRNYICINSENKLSTTTKEKSEDNTFNSIIQYMHQNVFSNLSLIQISIAANIGTTHLKVLFKQKTGMGVLEYFRNIKIEKAKVLIREGNYNITQIAILLNYSSIHHFSKTFKKVTGISPSEYAKSIMARAPFYT